MVSASENNSKIGYRLVSVELSVRMVHELPQTICLVLSKRKLADVALYSPACSCCCRNKRPTPDYYCGNVLESRGIGVGSSPIGREGFVKASKVQGSSLLLSNANNFVRYSYNIFCSFPIFLFAARHYFMIQGGSRLGIGSSSQCAPARRLGREEGGRDRPWYTLRGGVILEGWRRGCVLPRRRLG